MKAFPDQPASWLHLPEFLRDSWQRSARSVANPQGALAPIELDDDSLSASRRDHPLRLVLPVFEQLLVRPAAEAGLVVAIGDAAGRLLWVDGDRVMLRRAESQAFLPGANWSEASIGTSAPGLALATGRGAQVRQDEHFAASAHQFSCTAAPIYDPHTHRLLGVIDITGGQEAISTHSLPLVRAAISAAEAELAVLAPAPSSTELFCLGTSRPVITGPGGTSTLSLRHAEILLLLSWHTFLRGVEGLNAAALAELLYGEPGHEVALRAELVRLRRLVNSDTALSGLDLSSRPYRIQGALGVDAVHAAQAVINGDHAAALDLYRGQVLPASEAPGVLHIRRELSGLLRESMLADADGFQLWRYLQLPEADGDREAVYAALHALPAQAPQRAALVAQTQL